MNTNGVRRKFRRDFARELDEDEHICPETIDEWLSELPPCACRGKEPLKRFKAILRRYPSGAMQLHFKTPRAGDVPVEVLYLPISEPQEDGVTP